MATWDRKINRNTAWGGDKSTYGRPVSGRRIEEFIKDSLNEKIGYVYEDYRKGVYLGFQNKEACETYFKTHDESLIIDKWNTPDSSLYTGSAPPKNTNNLWVDTNDDFLDHENQYIYSIQKAIKALQDKIDVLMGIRVRGAISGKVEDGSRTDIIKTTTPIIPDQTIQDLYDQYQSGLIDEEDYYKIFDEDVKSGYIDQAVIDRYYDKGYISYEKWKEYSDIINDQDENGVKPNYSEGEEPTVSHISIKMGTWEQLQGNLINFVNGELLWCTDRLKLYINQNGTLYAIGGTNSDEPDMDEQTVREIIGDELQHVESIGFIPVGSDTAKYTAKVNEEGVLVVYENEMDNKAEAPTSNFYYNGSVSGVGLVINSFYLGGDNDEHSYQGCSHNFVEIANPWVSKDTAEGKDINLNGFYLLYTNGTGKWKSLPLWGKIPAGGTFLIRGAQCSVMDTNTTKLKVKTYDMQWYDTDEELIKFSQNSAVFYLCWADTTQSEPRFYPMGSDTPVTIDSFSISDNLIDTNTGSCAKGYIDMASFNNSNLFEKKTYILSGNIKASDVIFRRWYMLDPVTQSNATTLSKRNNVKYLTTSFLTGANVNNNIEEFTPKASFEKKSIANTRSLFLEDKPNTITCTFGIQATDNGEGATRGFCWNSVGYFNEYLLIRKKGTSDWTKIESIKSELTNIEYTSAVQATGYNVPKCIQSLLYYSEFTRMRWESSYGQSITTHKVLLSGIATGVYEYKIVRDEGIAYKDGYTIKDTDFTYQSEIREFTVKANSDVTSFNFVQTTDQQGANWEEYEVWNLSARIIAKAEQNKTIPDYNFIINTGDICYNGSRSNEWIDYFVGYEPLSNKEEMLTIGNNDLAPISMRDIGNGGESPWKINVNVIDYFYCVEIDTNNPQIFTGISNTTGNEISYKIPSLYSFNYGDFHFVSLLSEIRTHYRNTESEMQQTTVNTIFGIKDELRDNNPSAAAIYDVVEEWLIKDLLLWKGQSILNNFDRETERYNANIVGSCQKCILFIHEMPFNIISQTSYTAYENNNNTPRETAKAYLNRYHNFEFQRLFKLWDIRLLMGGHKHTAALTGPVYDAPPQYNPITKKIEEITTHKSDDILNDLSDSGVFDSNSSVRPFLQLTPEIIQSTTHKWGWDNASSERNIKKYCQEVYNNSSQDITISGITIEKQKYYKFEDVAKPRVRIEVVDSINAPQYVMCQATGFKNKSNSELAADIIPWEDFYVKSSSLSAQCYPFFTVYQVTPSNIDVKMYQIRGMYDAGGDDGSKAGYWDLNKIYVYGDTLEDNRNHYVNTCTLQLFNDNNGSGSIINLN